MLTGTAENIGDYYSIGKEIACFGSIADLIDKVRFFLRNDEQRATIARSGYERTRSDHTYVHRLTQVFRQMGFVVPDPEIVLHDPPAPGAVLEVI